jgi:hypothetical protein
MARVLLDDGDVQDLYSDGVRAKNPLAFVEQLVAAARTPGALAPGTEPSYVPERNSPCWCGSGSKYKKCCGFG